MIQNSHYFSVTSLNQSFSRPPAGCQASHPQLHCSEREQLPGLPEENPPGESSVLLGLLHVYVDGGHISCTLKISLSSSVLSKKKGEILSASGVINSSVWAALAEKAEFFLQ